MHSALAMAWDFCPGNSSSRHQPCAENRCHDCDLRHGSRGSQDAQNDPDEAALHRDPMKTTAVNWGGCLSGKSLFGLDRVARGGIQAGIAAVERSCALDGGLADP